MLIIFTGTYQFFENRGYIRYQNGDVKFVNSVLVGGLGGILGQLGCSPLFLIKTHLQAEAAAAIAVGHQHHHKGTINALRTIYVKHGVNMQVLAKDSKCIGDLISPFLGNLTN